MPPSVARQNDDLERTLQELESLHPANPDDAVRRYMPRWAGDSQAKRIAFLKGLSRNPNYQGTLAELGRSKVCSWYLLDAKTKLYSHVSTSLPIDHTFCLGRAGIEINSTFPVKRIQTAMSRHSS